MIRTDVIAALEKKYREIRADLDERGRRRWAASEARVLGWGGIAAVAIATGMSDRTIRTGIAELDDPRPLPPDRQRRPGSGRRSREQEHPGLAAALDALVEPTTRGDPCSPLRWTLQSTRSLSRALKAEGMMSATRRSLRC